MVEVPLKWRVGFTDEKCCEPEDFVRASAPGAVQIDWAAAKGMPDWNRDVNFMEYRWMEDCFWVYRTEIPKTGLEADEQLLFRSLGIDYNYEIWLDNELLYAYEGMFRPFELDVSKAAADGGELSIIIYPIPKNPDGTPDTRQEASASCKPAVSYGWDWHPRLVPTGIWDETKLCVVKKERIVDAEVFYTLANDLKQAFIKIKADINGYDSSHGLRFRLYSPDGDEVFCTNDIDAALTLDEPVLWWCNGYGKPNLYRWELSLEKDGRAIDKAAGKIGFRKVSLEMNPGTWLEPEFFPKTRSRAPITLTLNGTPIFAKGSNWVNPEIFPGIINAGTYRTQLEYARGANMNLLRIWGGAIVNKESFFEICDELGLMVWQEFPLSCCKFPDTEQYLSVLESEATAIIKRVRRHACHVMWCGGNELFNVWSMMTDQSQPLRLLNKLCYELDFGKPFLPTSPVFGMAHGCYLFVYTDGRDVYKAMSESHYTAYSEFGIPSLSNLETLLAATDRKNLFPLVKNDITLAHHAYEAWAVDESWCCIDILRGYLGEPESLEQFIEWSQWFQCEGYKCIFEEARRQKPYCSMALNWCFNEPWPTIANNSLLSYPAHPKPALTAVAWACRNQLASARLPKFSWSPGEEFTAEMWLLNDGPTPTAPGAMEIFLEYGGERHFVLRWDYPGAPANANLAGPTIRHILGGNGFWDGGGGRKFCGLTLILSAGIMSSEYKLIMKNPYYDKAQKVHFLEVE